VSEPRLPRNTCPAIDSVQESISDALRSLAGLNDELEDLRDANAKLRECAEHWMRRAEQAEDKLNALENARVY